MKNLFIVLIILSFSLAGCVSNVPRQGGVYNPNYIKSAGKAYPGIVISVRRVNLGATDTAKSIGQGIGGVVGGLAGMELAKNTNSTGQAIAGLVGMVAGSIAGDSLANKANGGDWAWEYIVKVNPSRYARPVYVTVVEQDPQPYRKGQTVFVVKHSSGGYGSKAVYRIVGAE